MKNEQALETLKEQARFYISTPERAAEALLFVRNLETFAEEIKEKVKARTVELMDAKNKEAIEYSIIDENGEVRMWRVTRSYGTESKEYRPENVIKAIGPDAIRFFKVGKIELEKYLKIASAKGEITMQQVEQAVADPVVKTRKGAGVVLREVKA